MAPVPAMLHCLGVPMLRYFDDWLVLTSSWTNALWARDTVLALCCDLGILVSLAKSQLVPAWSATYLGMVIVSPALWAFPSREDFGPADTDRQISILQVIKCRFLAQSAQSPVVSVSAGSMQLVLRSSWDFEDESVEVEWSPSN